MSNSKEEYQNDEIPQKDNLWGIDPEQIKLEEIAAARLSSLKVEFYNDETGKVEISSLGAALTKDDGSLEEVKTEADGEILAAESRMDHDIANRVWTYKYEGSFAYDDFSYEFATIPYPAQMERYVAAKFDEEQGIWNVPGVVCSEKLFTVYTNGNNSTAQGIIELDTIDGGDGFGEVVQGFYIDQDGGYTPNDENDSVMVHCIVLADSKTEEKFKDVEKSLTVSQDTLGEVAEAYRTKGEDILDSDDGPLSILTDQEADAATGGENLDKGKDDLKSIERWLRKK